MVSFVDVNFTMIFNMILKWLGVNFDTLWTSKNEHFAWRVLQKSNFRVVGYRMHMGIDFARLLGPGLRQFWVPIGVHQRL